MDYAQEVWKQIFEKGEDVEALVCDRATFREMQGTVKQGWGRPSGKLHFVGLTVFILATPEMVLLVTTLAEAQKRLAAAMREGR